MDLVNYPVSPGYKREGTSQQAAADMAGKAPTLREQVMALIRGAGQHGMTADECAERLGQPITTIRPRLSELNRMRAIGDSDMRRRNESGKMATVWRAL